MLATSAARYPKDIDFSCGFQSLRPSGTRSSARRVEAASRSRSARNNSVIFIIGNPFLKAGGLVTLNHNRVYMTSCVIISGKVLNLFRVCELTRHESRPPDVRTAVTAGAWANDWTRAGAEARSL